MKYPAREAPRGSVLIFSTDDYATGCHELLLPLLREKRPGQTLTIAVSGGAAPQPLYRSLSRADDINWNSIGIYQVDERFVPADHPDSNQKMLRELLPLPQHIPETSFHPINTALRSADAAARDYASALAALAATGAMPKFDIILLGIGADGHTASLFPGGPGLRETQRTVIGVPPAGNPTVARVTLTLPVINNAKHVIFIVRGAEKAGLVRRIIIDRDCELPATLVSPKNGQLSFWLDDGAASQLLLNRVLKNSTL